jgi:hypothetical protein
MQIEIDDLKRRIAELEAAQEKILENSINIIMNQSCEKHAEVIRSMTFGEFLEYNRGCVHCAKERVAELEAAAQWHPASEPPKQDEDYLSEDKAVMTSQGYGIAHYNYPASMWVFVYRSWASKLDYAVQKWRDLPSMPEVKS